MAILYRPDGSVAEVFPDLGDSFRLDELQALVGGYIETLSFEDGSGRILLVNEDGYQKELRDNEKASELLRGTRYHGTIVVGNALLTTAEEI